MNSYTIIEDIFEDDQMRIPTTTNQSVSPQPFIRKTHTPSDMREIRGHQERERGEIREREIIGNSNNINNINNTQEELLDLRSQDSNQQCYQQQQYQREQRQYRQGNKQEIQLNEDGYHHQRSENEDGYHHQRSENEDGYHHQRSEKGLVTKQNSSSNIKSAINKTILPQIQCKDIFDHVDSCHMCTSYFKKDVNFYWLIIAILLSIILLLSRNKK
jgi:hypothetical protein